MLKIYGSLQCPDCVACCAALDDAGVDYTFLEFNDSLLHLKEFLKLRDSEPLFGDARENGYIGIPCIVDDSGAVSLNWEQYVSQEKS